MFTFTGARPLLLRKTLIGDSMLRDIVRLPNTKVICKPGIKLSALADSIFTDSRYALQQSDLVIIHAGTNDINTCSSTELLGTVQSIVTRYRNECHGHIGFSTIIPRPRDGQKLAYKVKIFNQTLLSWCALNGCVCLRTHGPFLKGGWPRSQLFNKGLLHLTNRGPSPSGAYVLKNWFRSELSEKLLLPRIKDVEAKFFGV